MEYRSFSYLKQKVNVNTKIPTFHWESQRVNICTWFLQHQVQGTQRRELKVYMHKSFNRSTYLQTKHFAQLFQYRYIRI